MQYELRMLSPLHIGCGEEYNGLYYLVDNGTLYYFEPEAVFGAIGQNAALRFAGWIAERSGQLDAVQAKIREARGDRDKARHYREQEKVISKGFTLKAFLQELSLDHATIHPQAAYQVEVPRIFWADQKIVACIKQAVKPYIPGSEIKGAIRTAVLYNRLLNDAKLQSFLKDRLAKFQAAFQSNIDEVANKPHPDKKIKRKLNEEVAKIEAEFQARALRTQNDAKFDLLKFLAIGDSELLDPATSIKVAAARPVNASRPFTINNEYLKPGLQVSLPGTGLEGEHSRTVRLRNMAEDAETRFRNTVENFLAFCHAFSSDLLNTEKKYFRNAGNSAVVRHLAEIESQNTSESPVLRLGKDEGFFSMTMGMAIKKLWPDLYEQALIHATTGKSYDDDNGGLLPKTRKLVQWERDTELTAGWVKLIPPGIGRESVSEKETSGTFQKNGGRNQDKLPDVSALLHKFGKKRR